MARRMSWMWIVVSCAACASAPEVRELATPAPCVLDEATVTDFPLHATHCPVFVDGRGVSPDAFNVWARVSIVIQPLDAQGWREGRREYIEAFTRELLVERAIAEAGFDPPEEEIEAFLLIGVGDEERRREKLATITNRHRSVQEVEAMWRRGAVRYAYACRQKGCTPSEDEARAYYGAHVASSGRTYEEARQEVFSSLYLNIRYDAYLDVVGALVAGHDVEFRPEALVVRGVPEGRRR